MLRVQNVCKEYRTGGYVQRALDHVSLDLRDNEFVAILGPSGSGKTTLLNVIGGLDRYDSGDLIINGVSTKAYSDRDWDAYRNHSVGFIFQSYNLIPHQTVLANVELALTISGLSGAERTRRAAQALERVGLGEQIHKKPSQMSGGQMQRVAIARALVNEPDILLADEPTGALDSKTSVQVMELLKEVAQDKLVVMVTHNPELAYEYATRIIELKDGQIRADSDPYTAAEENTPTGKGSRPKHIGMSLWTATALSFHNLWTKRKRTLLVSFAGSIGIIGIALIMALSNGMNRYIDSVEQETLSEYPITLGSTSVDASTLDGLINLESTQEKDYVTERKIISDLFSKINTNDLTAFKRYLDSGESGIGEYARAIEYRYGVAPLIYSEQNGRWRQVNPDTTLSSLGFLSSAGISSLVSAVGGADVFHALPEDKSLYLDKYGVKAGRWPESHDECVLVLTADGSVSDMALYAMGLHDSAELDGLVSAFLTGGSVGGDRKPAVYDYRDFLGIEFRLVNAAELYSYDRRHGLWTDKSGDETFVSRLAEDGETLTIVGVVQSMDGIASSVLDAGISYTPALVRHVIEAAADSEIVQAQLASPDTDVFTGKPFGEEQIADAFDFSALFDVDEDTIISAFGINESAITLPELDMADVELPDMGDFGSMELSLPSFDSGDIARLCEAALRDVTREEASRLFHDLLAGYLAYADLEEIIDLGVLRQRLRAYISDLDPGEFSIDYAALQEIFDYDELRGRIGAYLERLDSEPPSEEELTAIIADYISESLQNAGLWAEPIGAYLKQISEDELLAIFSDFFAEELGDLDDFSESFADYLNTNDARTMIENAVAGLVDADVLESELGRIVSDYSGEIASQIAGVVEQLVLAIVGNISDSLESSLASLLDELTGADLAELITVDTDVFVSALSLGVDDSELLELVTSLFSSEEATLEGNLSKLGYAEDDAPATITIYLVDFEGKYEILDMIDAYNAKRLAAGEDDEVITYSDVVGTMMRSVTNIINAVSYVLIAFVAISLIVSSIMIGFITYISVLERKKEIGILRAMGASRHNITEVFNAETFIIGGLSGVFGIALSLLLLIPGNMLLRRLISQVEIVAKLPFTSSLLLIALSIALTLLGGLIPARKAAKSDPVVALRSE